MNKTHQVLESRLKRQKHHLLRLVQELSLLFNVQIRSLQELMMIWKTLKKTKPSGQAALEHQKSRTDLLLLPHKILHLLLTKQRMLQVRHLLNHLLFQLRKKMVKVLKLLSQNLRERQLMTKQKHLKNKKKVESKNCTKAVTASGSTSKSSSKTLKTP